MTQPKATLHHGDYLDVMAAIRSSSIDAIIADPPFGTTNCGWDVAPDWPRWWAEARRVCKPDAFVVLFTAMPAALEMISPARRHFRYDLVAHKNLAVGFLDANRRPLRNHELIWVFAFGHPKWNRHDLLRDCPNRKIGSVIRNGATKTEIYSRADKELRYTYGPTECPKSVIRMIRPGNYRGKERGQVHPTGKPLQTMEWLVKSYSPEGGSVLDSWMGGGTTGEACVNTGRIFTGSELDPAFFAFCEQRIRRAEIARSD